MLKFFKNYEQSSDKMPQNWRCFNGEQGRRDLRKRRADNAWVLKEP